LVTEDNKYSSQAAPGSLVLPLHSGFKKALIADKGNYGIPTYWDFLTVIKNSSSPLKNLSTIPPSFPLLTSNTRTMSDEEKGTAKVDTSPALAADEAELARMGYKQELKSVQRLLLPEY
jgi:hypothetical protein